VAQSRHFDLIIIGGGPGGYVGAIRAAQLGLKVACVERDKLGGVCLNWGCIPSKALLANAEAYEKILGHETWGLKIKGGKGAVSLDWETIIGRSRDVAGKLNQGVAFLLKKNKVEHIDGNARITAAATGGKPCTIEISDCAVEAERTDCPVKVGKPRETITATNVLIATGSVARDLPFAKFGENHIWGAREAMYNKEVPKKLVVVGAGAIGMEFGYFYHTFGCEVTVVEMLDAILPVEDEEISKAMGRHFKKAGMKLKTGHITLAIDKTKTGAKVTIAPFKKGKADESKKETIDADKVLLAIGVKGRYDGLFDDKLGLETIKDHIKTDFVPLNASDAPGDAKAIDYKTNLPGIYAIGDVIGPPWLAHVASEEAIICVERIAWRAGKLDHEPIPIDYTVIPGCTYCNPQVASVGFTEQSLKARGLKKGTDYEVGSFPFTALGKAIATMHTQGMTKIIRGLPRGEILGAHIMGDQATELIAEMTLARRLEATSEELIVTMHAHPTMHESVHEAAMASEGRVIHM
jgi:dihydrolipoyl dehydrogenase